MTTYTTIASTEIDQDSPITQPLMTKLRDNPIAMAESATGAAVIAQGWCPYDMVTVGDGNDGVIYDFAVDGAVATLDSPTFADGFTYRFYFEQILGSSTPTTDNFQMRFSYVTAGLLGTATLLASINSVDGEVTLGLPRASGTTHKWAAYTVVDNTTAVSHGAYSRVQSPAEKIAFVRFKAQAGNLAGGKIYMYRRKDLFS